MKEDDSVQNVSLDDRSYSLMSDYETDRFIRSRKTFKSLFICSIVAILIINICRYLVIAYSELETLKVTLDWVLLALYSIVTFSFIPLFLTIVNLLKLVIPALYQQIRSRMLTIFSLFIFFLLMRLYLYADLKFFHLYFNQITVFSTIPFYVTEFIITASLSYVLYMSTHMEQSGRGESQHHQKTPLEQQQPHKRLRPQIGEGSSDDEGSLVPSRSFDMRSRGTTQALVKLKK